MTKINFTTGNKKVNFNKGDYLTNDENTYLGIVCYSPSKNEYCITDLNGPNVGLQTESYTKLSVLEENYPHLKVISEVTITI